jgi:subtilisin family serine protease
MSPSRALVSLVAVAALAGPPAAAANESPPAAPSSAPPATLAPSLAARLAHARGALPVVVTLRDQARAADAGCHRHLIRCLQRVAERSQPALLRGLPRRPARPMWLVNAVALQAEPSEIRRLARDPAVARIEYDRRVRLFGPADAAGPGGRPGLFGRGDWGLAAIGAPAVWRDYGLDGRGVRVGSIDTGIEADHPELAGKVAAWRDFANGRPKPYDDNGHGTHTIGTMVGGAAAGAPVGVAPGARVVVAKALDRYGDATLSTLMAAAEWMTDPDGNPSTDDFPAVVNASWGAPEAAGDALRPIIERWRELGIVPVFAAGNSGPRGSVPVPAAYPGTLAVGAMGPGARIAPFSSRGPAWAEHGRPPGLGGTPFVRKPDLVAPGVQIISSVPGGSWASLSGTSMAAPHVAGAIALLRQADRGVTPDAIAAILRRTARPVEPGAGDGRSGAGAVDVRAAAALLLGARAPRPEISMVATPPARTNDARLAFAVESGGAPVGVWLDGARVGGIAAGPVLRVPAGAPGRHTVAVAALDPGGSALGTPRRFRVTIDRERPRLELATRREDLLETVFLARAADPVAGVAGGSLRVRVSESPGLWRRPEGRYTFTGAGPYWVEAEVADRAGNVRRVRRALRWAPAPVARRLAWNDAMINLRWPFIMARRHRRFDGHYLSSRRLTRLLAANCAPRAFVALAAPADPPPGDAVGVWSDGRSRVVLSARRAGRLYFMEDRDGRARRGVRPAAAQHPSAASPGRPRARQPAPAL